MFIENQIQIYNDIDDSNTTSNQSITKIISPLITYSIRQNDTFYYANIENTLNTTLYHLTYTVLNDAYTYHKQTVLKNENVRIAFQSNETPDVIIYYYFFKNGKMNQMYIKGDTPFIVY
ncbi:MAG: hypothetical protein PHN72_07005 [Bacilli bacterium]|nr:hypothetical protein [Bacilli bacterium]